MVKFLRQLKVVTNYSENLKNRDHTLIRNNIMLLYIVFKSSVSFENKLNESIDKPKELREALKSLGLSKKQVN